MYKKENNARNVRKTGRWGGWKLGMQKTRSA